MTTTYTPPQRSVLIDNLSQRLKAGDNSVLHKLRVAANTPETPDHAVTAAVYPYTGRDYLSQDAGMITAMAWAVWHRRRESTANADGVNLGAALRRADPRVIDRCFQALVRAHRSTLPRAVVQAVAALAPPKPGVPLDWHQLHHDLRRFLYGHRDQVLRRWETGLYAPVLDTDTDDLAEGA